MTTENDQYGQAEELLHDLRYYYAELNSLRDNKRQLDDRLLEVEASELTRFAAGMSNTNPSPTAVERAWRIAKTKNPNLIEMKKKLRDTLRDIDQAEARVDMIRKELNYKTARLNHLGGELQVQAALGSVETVVATKQDKTGETE